ncbi:peptide chain release factor N(5)-glutamine methyltransferase [Pseudidiomarina aestuarii]|uniref:Release factor glutamine methyltransferase n=1 Tax=Pseudidiomarina aestuarii TaxID=624146 RepID=A0A7Z6ZTZ9_9GAMM|nr:peptide chain release factor N(5)-glutamine methyltransferase [Pseudidiomarina aestuarii]RUO41368.1 peptide chain release factor N(5)-glutamine methyltransferase [Pseudidiomarina aestuarii]
MIIRAALQWARTELTDSDSQQMDAEVLVAAAMQRSRTYLHTWPEQELSAAELEQLQHWVLQRKNGVPIAYLLGSREFWSLDLEVNNTTLIPRPDTEVLVETALQLDLSRRSRVLDLGTGTGAIALALKSERTEWEITAVDRIPAALALARSNSRRLNLPIQVLESHWFAALRGQQFDLIVSNPPYIDAEDPHLSQGDVRFEPASALVAEQAGLADLRVIVEQAAEFLEPNGWLALEHGWQQAAAVRELLVENGFEQVHSRRDYGNLERVSCGQIATMSSPKR